MQIVERSSTMITMNSKKLLVREGEKFSHVRIAGPRRGFSLKGWKENLPRYLEKRQDSSFK